jgi:hypothetical protein
LYLTAALGRHPISSSLRAREHALPQTVLVDLAPSLRHVALLVVALTGYASLGFLYSLLATGSFMLLFCTDSFCFSGTLADHTSAAQFLGGPACRW